MGCTSQRPQARSQLAGSRCLQRARPRRDRYGRPGPPAAPSPPRWAPGREQASQRKRSPGAGGRVDDGGGEPRGPCAFAELLYAANPFQGVHAAQRSCRLSPGKSAAGRPPKSGHPRRAAGSPEESAGTVSKAAQNPGWPGGLPQTSARLPGGGPPHAGAETGEADRRASAARLRALRSRLPESRPGERSFRDAGNGKAYEC